MNERTAGAFELQYRSLFLRSVLAKALLCNRIFLGFHNLAHPEMQRNYLNFRARYKGHYGPDERFKAKGIPEDGIIS